MNAVLNNVVKKIGDMKQELGHKVWLVGLGAYTKSVEEFNGLSGKSQSLMEDLLARGLEVERSLKELICGNLCQKSAAFEERLHGVFARVSGVKASYVADLQDRLQALSQQVEALLENNNAGETAPKAASRRTPAQAKSAE